MPTSTLHVPADWDESCPVVVGMARNATQDILVCGEPQPCPEHGDRRREHMGAPDTTDGKRR